ncbi:WD40-repeat-containing domain protein [Mycena filopes]|nr:WD40-repeat-containing domain protein [Mycena filopes]
MAQYSRSQTLIPPQYSRSQSLLAQSSDVATQDAVNALIFFDKGTMLASGGDDQTVRIWAVGSGRLQQELKDRSWGQITNLSVVVNGAGEFLFIGTGRGVVSVLFWDRSAKCLDKSSCFVNRVFQTEEPVECQAVNSATARFIAASARGEIRMHSIKEHKQLVLMWKCSVGHIVPRGLGFLGDNTNHVGIYPLKPGPITDPRWHLHICLREERKGSVALAANGRITAVHNIKKDEFEIYNSGSQLPVCLIVSANSGKLKGATFADHNNTLVCGGDDGFIHIFDAATGALCQQLTQDDCSTVYALAACTTKDEHLIATGGTEDPAKIYIWTNKLYEEHQDLLRRDAQTARALEVRDEEERRAQHAQDAKRRRDASNAKLNMGIILACFALFVGVANFCYYNYKLASVHRERGGGGDGITAVVSSRNEQPIYAGLRPEL